MTAKKKVSIIIPCYNEAGYITRCLDSIVANSYPKESLELLVIDGGSTDGTNAVLESYNNTGLNLKLYNNPRRIQAAALNIGLGYATGEVLMRMDAHCEYSDNYVHSCVAALDDESIGSVGGRWIIKARGSGKFDQAVALVLADPFGVGRISYRSSSSVNDRWVDTVPFFCMSRNWISKVGHFNEMVGPSEDVEFYSRLKKIGGRIKLLGNVYSVYFARSDFWSFVKHNFRNGVWAVLPFCFSKTPGISFRHLVPGCFIAVLIISAAFSLLEENFKFLFLAVVFSYSIFVIFAALSIGRKNDCYGNCLRIAFAMVTMHFSYGIGSNWGLIRALSILAFGKGVKKS